MESSNHKVFSSFIAFSLLHTGYPHYRVFEIAAIRYGPNGIEEEWSRLLSPKLFLSRQRQQYYGVTNQELETKPVLYRVLPEFVKFVGTLPLVAHFCSYQLSFFREYSWELVPIEYRFCTWRLAQKVLSISAEEASLEEMRKYFHFKRASSSKARENAFLTARVFSKLFELLQKKIPVLSLEALRRIQWECPLPSLLSKPQKWPSSPGIFYAKDAQKNILYIGMGANLQATLERLFVQSRRKGLSNKLKKMIQQIDQLDVEICGHELEAEIKEAFLVGEHRPPYNQLLNRLSTHIYLKISTDVDSPKISISEKYVSKGHFFGPFQKRDWLEKFLEALSVVFFPQDFPREEQEFLPLFDKNPLPSSQDILFARESYLKTLEDVIALFQGRSWSLLQQIDQKIQHFLKELQVQEAEKFSAYRRLIQEGVEYLLHLQKVTLKNYLVLLPGRNADTYHLLPVIQGRVHPFWVYHRYQQSLADLAQKVLVYFFLHQYPSSKPLEPFELHPSLTVYRWMYEKTHDFVGILMDNMSQEDLYFELERKIPLVRSLRSF